MGEVLPEEVRSSRLQRFAILHHRLDAIGVHRAGESLALSLLALDDGHRHPVLREIRVNLEHLQGFHHRLVAVGMGGVAFLPEELGGAQEKSRAHFPAHNIRPLVDEQRKIAVALHPLRETCADDGFGSWAHNQRFLQFARRNQAGLAVGFDAGRKAVMGDDGALLREALDMLGFLLEVRQRDEQREVRVLVAGVLEHLVEHALDILPDRVAPGLNDHAAANIAVLGEFGGAHDLLVPLGIVLRAGRGDGGGGSGLLLAGCVLVVGHGVRAVRARAGPRR